MAMNDDGKAHFAYYDAERLLSYVWDGGTRIEVSPGGYAEPVVARIPSSIEMMQATSPTEALLEFRHHVRKESNPFNVDLEVYPR